MSRTVETCRPERTRARYLLSAPTGGEIDMSLSFSTTSRSMSGVTPALFSASKAMPAVIAPSPITATCRRRLGPLFSPLLREAHAIPSAAEIEVDEWAVPKVSYSLSLRRGNPDTPPCWRSVDMPARRPVRILCG